MKKVLIAAIFIIFSAVSCSDDDPNPVVPAAESYLNSSAGNRWDYEVTNNTPPPPSTTSYSLTATSEDTVFGTRTYYIFTNNAGPDEYNAVSGSDYYTYFTFPDPINQQAEYLYLKANAAQGTSWLAASFSVSGIPITVTNTIAEKGIARTVNGINYTNVIHVTSAITAPGVPIVSNIHSYYAPGKGLIENSIELSSTLFPGVTVDTDTRLMSTNF